MTCNYCHSTKLERMNPKYERPYFVIYRCLSCGGYEALHYRYTKPLDDEQLLFTWLLVNSKQDAIKVAKYLKNPNINALKILKEAKSNGSVVQVQCYPESIAIWKQITAKRAGIDLQLSGSAPN